MQKDVGTVVIKRGLAQMLKGGVIMDVVTPEQAKIAEEAGACAVMALERVPGGHSRAGRRGAHERSGHDRGHHGGGDDSGHGQVPHRALCRSADAGSARRRLHRRERSADARRRSSIHVDKHDFKVPFVCGCRNLGEALRRIGEGAAMMRTKGEAGTGDVVEAVRHARAVLGEIRRLQTMAGRRADGLRQGNRRAV